MHRPKEIQRCFDLLSWQKLSHNEVAQPLLNKGLTSLKSKTHLQKTVTPTKDLGPPAKRVALNMCKNMVVECTKIKFNSLNSDLNFRMVAS